MNFIAIMELIGVGAALTAAFFFLFGRVQRLSGRHRAFFASLLVTVLANAFLDFSEWMVPAEGLDVIEDYVDVLTLLVWGTCFLSLFAEPSAKERQKGYVHHLFAQQLVFVLAALLVLNVVLGLTFFTKSRVTLVELDDYHGDAIVAVANLRSESNDAIQESFAYAVSGEATEKQEFERWAQSFEAEAEAFRAVGKLDEPDEREDLAIFEATIALQTSLVHSARRMFEEYEKNGKVSLTTFQDYEAVVDEFSSRLGELQRSERASHDDSQATATRMLEAARVEMPILGGISVVLSASLFGLLIWNFRRYAAEQELAQRELVASEAMQRRLLDGLPELIWVAGVDRRWTHVNKTWLEFTGRTVEEELGNGWGERVHPDAFAQRLETLNSAFDARDSYTMEYRLRRHDGQYRWILDSAAPWTQSDGQFAGFIGGCIDITERKKTEHALRESELRLRLML